MRGWVDDARAEEERARQGIEQMREGIEKAAENVLGDETKALKAAREKLKDLNRELDQEIKNQDPSQESPDADSAPPALNIPFSCECFAKQSSMKRKDNSLKLILCPTFCFEFRFEHHNSLQMCHFWFDQCSI